MNYQIFLDCHDAGTTITKQEAVILALDLDIQIASIKVSRTHSCIEVAPDHICKAALVCKGSLWITCFVAVVDQIKPIPIGRKARGTTVFDALVKNDYVVMD